MSVSFFLSPNHFGRHFFWGVYHPRKSNHALPLHSESSSELIFSMDVLVECLSWFGFASERPFVLSQTHVLGVTFFWGYTTPEKVCTLYLCTVNHLPRSYSACMYFRNVCLAFASPVNLFFALSQTHFFDTTFFWGGIPPPEKWPRSPPAQWIIPKVHIPHGSALERLFCYCFACEPFFVLSQTHVFDFTFFGGGIPPPKKSPHSPPAQWIIPKVHIPRGSAFGTSILFLLRLWTCFRPLTNSCFRPHFFLRLFDDWHILAIRVQFFWKVESQVLCLPSTSHETFLRSPPAQWISHLVHYHHRCTFGSSFLPSLWPWTTFRPLTDSCFRPHPFFERV